jgi:hypothetical protein
MILTTALKYKRWWDTDRCRQWPLTGLVLHSLGKRMAYVGEPIPANDRDHCRW